MVNKVKLSDFIADFIAKKKVKTVFAVSGGASLHLIHSIDEHPKLNYVCTHHEQAAAMAADGYSRVTGNIGVAISTSGPGATNLITGICCSYYDSVPLIVITGQVSTFRMTGESGVRQIGFQETPIVSITKEITKYSKTIIHPNDIKYELEKAFFLATEGRPGPVLIDVPDNLQREFVDVSDLKGFFKDESYDFSKLFPDTKNNFQTLIQYLKNAKRPVAIGGWGVHLSKTESDLLKFINFFHLPIALTWGCSDLLPRHNQLYIGTFGTHGVRHANFAVQNADLIISFGSRLDTKSTGSPVNTFAREAKKIMIDIDPNELGKFAKFNLYFDVLIQDDLKKFFNVFEDNLNKFDNDDFYIEKHKSWIDQIGLWKKVLDDKSLNSSKSPSKVNPYSFFERLSNKIDNNSMIFIDTGCSIAWAMQAMSFGGGKKVFHDFNNTAMGWALPASIGAHFANSDKEIICIVGDGSFMMSLQELATVMHHQIKLKLIVINNNGYSMIKQTQEQWLNSRYVASSKDGGISFPKFDYVAQTFDLDYFLFSNIKTDEKKLNSFLNNKKASLLEVEISPDARVIPQVKFGRPNEDMEPLLPRKIFKDNMIVKPIDH